MYPTTGFRVGLLALAAAAGLVGCGDYLSVTDPNIVDARDIDPATDAPTLAMSAQQDFTAAYTRFVPYGAWFTGELFSADVNQPGHLVVLRRVDNTHGALNGTLFGPLSRTRALADRVIRALAGTSGETSIHAARAELFAGYAFLVMAEHFCVGAVDGGPPLSTTMMLDSAVTRLTRAADLSRTLPGPEAADFVDVALVGRARAHLQAGRAAPARTDAQAVRPGFTYNLRYLDDLGNRARVSNQVWFWTFSQTLVSAAPSYRNLGDPRVALVPPEVNRHVPMDGETAVWSLQKYQNYAAPIRLASRLEADYIAAEAEGTPEAMLALIQARRAANSQAPYEGPLDQQSLLRELLEQKGRDLYVEGKRMADFRRHPTLLNHVVPTGTPYHKVGFPAYADQMCWPLPFKESANNPNL